jgi:hypothetical protein
VTSTTEAHPLACSCLDCLIRRLRDEVRAETPMKLHARAVPVLRDYDGIPTTAYPDEGGTGLPFSAAFHRYLGHADSWGTSRLGMSSILEISEACAARHPTHRRPLFTRSLCSELAFQVAYLGQTVDDIAWLHSMSREQVSGLLTWALRHAELWRIERFMRLTREPGHETPLPERRSVA